jgi:hypothetical protein
MSGAAADRAQRPISFAAPFRHSAFTVIWTATLVSNVGGWMYSAASGWLMTSLDPDPLMVALVQAASSLPICLFAIPAGALADIFDKRRFLIVVETITTVVSAVDFVRDVISFGGGLYVIEELVDTVDHRLVWVPGDSEAATLDEESLACPGFDLPPNLVRAQCQRGVLHTFADRDPCQPGLASR